MTKITLINGGVCLVEETVEQVTQEISSSIEWVRLTLILEAIDGAQDMRSAMFMKSAIAFWHN